MSNVYLEFAIYRKGLNSKISGQQVFNSLIEYLKSNTVTYKGIKGLWSVASDNTIVFNKAISKGYPKKKKHLKLGLEKKHWNKGLIK